MILQHRTKGYSISFPVTLVLQQNVKILCGRKKGRKETNRNLRTDPYCWQGCIFPFCSFGKYVDFSLTEVTTISLSEWIVKNVWNSQSHYPARSVKQNLLLEIILHCFLRCSALWWEDLDSVRDFRGDLRESCLPWALVFECLIPVDVWGG